MQPSNGLPIVRDEGNVEQDGTVRVRGLFR
jgi:hypothetical protein